LSKALAAYRQEDFGAAIDWCSPARVPRVGIERWVWFRDVQADLVVAMAHPRLGHQAEASQSLEAAQKILNRASQQFEQHDLKRSWHDLLTCRPLEREAVALIKGASPVDATTTPQNTKSSGDSDPEPR
jgi:hypothetical protein